MLRYTWHIKSMQEANIFKSLLACLNSRVANLDLEFFLNRFHLDCFGAELAVRSKHSGIVSSVYLNNAICGLDARTCVTDHSTEVEKQLLMDFILAKPNYLCYSISSGINEIWSQLDVRDLESSSVEELGLKLSMQGF